MTTQTEIERKYDVDEKAVLPDLSEIAAVEPAGEAELEAEYFDTENGDLAAHRIVLRRRRGGGDEGWHIKLPAAEGRTELHWPLTDDDAPPREVVDQVRSRVRGRDLVVIARLRTHRSLTHLVTDEGAPLLEVADDRVSATDATSGTLRLWREWEVELLDGAPGSASERSTLLDAVEERLVSAGATPSASRSKLATALGRTDLDGGSGASDAAAPDLDASSPAAAVLLVAVGALVDDLARIDPLVRGDEHDAVHQLRTRIRRLRSLFASYRSVFDREVTDPLRDRLREVGTSLGEARDAEVMRDRARSLLEDHEPQSRDVKRLPGALAEEYATAHARAVTELDGERWLSLLDDLDAFVARPALTADAMETVSDAVPPALHADLHRVLTRAKAARRADSEDERVLLLHDVRKAAKRLRYAAEAVSQGDAAVFGKKTRKFAAAAEAVHDLLGEHRDSMLMQQHLRETAGSEPSAFDYGVLHEVERHGAALCLADYPAALAELRSFK
ncbi:CYTH and CHAD domain-containing protein [Conyzicola nivalis]|uniref:CHAD domain-containing protein n=1 Tax=Conyzicola nivalis TaxID=1477021 RepID=A0A916STP7_9MICO|nr:CYTH and CHAD domain-containing protein [Conyzicola nivalis]GGB13315.1 CHAD domain-containing protein [Conyzicola nivalis]